MALVPGRLLLSQRALFSIPEDIAYFNCAYLSPLLNSVATLGEQGVRRKAAPWTITADDFFRDSERLRHQFATLINGQSSEMSIVPAASYGVAIAARNVRLKRNQEVLVLEGQFPSNYYAWLRLAQRVGASLRTVRRPSDGDWTSAVLASLTVRVAVLAVPNCHWADGGILDLEVIGAECRARNIALVLDLTQSLGALPFDVRRIRPAFAVAAAYKWLLGPYSMALLYVDEEYQNGEPLEDNWIARRGSERFSAVSEYTNEFAAGARRFDVGERANFALVPMAIGAIEQLLTWGVANIAYTLGSFNARLAEALAAVGLRTFPRQYSALHFLSLELPASVPPDFATTLARDNVFVSVRGRSLRVTPHLYNTAEDADRLLASLARNATALAGRSTR
jgi:selenocysteine lyase/cysteine desulfurase